MSKTIWSIAVILLSNLAACGTGGGVGDLCSGLEACSAGGSQFCKSGSRCFYQLTDGSTIKCVDCGNCQAAASALSDWCNGLKLPDLGSPALPSPAFIDIPKSGPAYTGTVNDPKLSQASDCPDSQLEPNDALDDAKDFPLSVDSYTPKLVRLAICPFGNNDVDVFRIAVASSGATLMAEIFYDISYGDLDVAILDDTGAIVASDGTSVSNGCATTTTAVAVYYVVVTGANHSAVNRYNAHFRLLSTPLACP